jgi:hypothetical protein
LDPSIGVIKDEEWLSIVRSKDFYESRRSLGRGATRLFIHELLGSALHLGGDPGVEQKLWGADRKLLAAFGSLRADLIRC